MNIKIEDFMDDIFKLIIGLHCPNKTPEGTVGRDEIDRLIISTVFTSDMGYETAVIDSVGAHPVERYPDKEHAIRGHARWCMIIVGKTEIFELGYGSLLGEERIILKRK